MASKEDEKLCSERADLRRKNGGVMMFGGQSGRTLVIMATLKEGGGDNPEMC